MIVVFDSGIWVSAMEFGGTPLEAVIRAIAQDRFAVCDQIEEEVVRADPRGGPATPGPKAGLGIDKNGAGCLDGIG